ncbi:MAG: 4Fe-4S ferredoxin [Bacteroidales bacterium]|nr:4Fe-4S ferredoxin [Bacteroidales bacterium]
MKMIREIVKIDEDICNGCGDCIPNCHEGALQIIDGKARLINDLLCDGLGACIGYCPMGAISIEKRETEPYNETKVMEIMVEKGKNTVIAHLQHLKDHDEIAFMQEGIQYLKKHAKNLLFDAYEVIQSIHNYKKNTPATNLVKNNCVNNESIQFAAEKMSVNIPHINQTSGQSQLRHWPIQLHLINPQAQHFQNADILIAADCVAFSLGNFHDTYLKGKSLAIACPKLDSNIDVYIHKLTEIIDYANIHTLTAMIMEVPCCKGLLQIVRKAVAQAQKKIPIHLIVIGIKGNIIDEKWIETSSS